MKLKLKLYTALLAAVTVLSPLSASAAAPNAAGGSSTALESYGRLPLSFEPTPSPALFVARSGGYSMLIGPASSSVTVAAGKNAAPKTLRFRFDRGNAQASLEAFEPLPGVTNYYIGNDPANWREGVHSFARLRERGVYPGVDVVYYGDNRRLEFDFVVAPHADPRPIALSMDGMDKLYKDSGGDLVAEVGGKALHLAKPYAYQRIEGRVSKVEADYVLSADGRATLRLGKYNRNVELIVDPTVSFATYLGGSQGDTGNAIAVVNKGTPATDGIYVTGQTCSPVFPTGSSNALVGACDAYVTKYNISGTVAVYTTILGGTLPANATASGNGVAVDYNNNVYVTGTTNMNNMPGPPTCSPVYPPSNPNCYQGGDSDVFIIELNSLGAVSKGTYLGGSAADAGYSIAVDTSTDITGPYISVVGQTCSDDFPFYSAIETKLEPCVAFFTRLDNNLDIGTRIYSEGNTAAQCNAAYSGWLWTGPASYPFGGCCLPGQTGCVWSNQSGLLPPVGDFTSFPISTPTQTYFFSEPYGGQPPGPNSTAGWMPYTFYPAGTIVIDPNGNSQISENSGCSGALVPASVAGGPLPNWSGTALGTTPDGGYVCNPLSDVCPSGVAQGCGTQITWANFGKNAGVQSAYTEAYGVALDPQGDLFAAGGTSSTEITTTYGWPCHPLPGSNASGPFVIKIGKEEGDCRYKWWLATGSADQTATINVARAVAVDSEGRAYVTGTASGGFATTGNSYNGNGGGGIDAFLFRVNELGSAIEYATYLGGSARDEGLGVAVDSNFSAYVTGSTQSLDFPTVNPLSDPNTLADLPLSGSTGGFITKFTPDGSGILLSSYFGGSEADQGNAVAVDSSGNIYVAGTTSSTDLLTTLLTTPFAAPNYVPPQSSYEGNGDAFMFMVPSSSIPSVTVTPGSLAFPAQATGVQSTPPQVVSFTIQSTSPTVPTVHIKNITFSNPDFSQVFATGQTGNNIDCEVGPVGPAATVPSPSGCVIRIAFTPSVQGFEQGTLTIRDDTTSVSHVVNLTGDGATPTDSYGPSALVFPSQAVGTSSTSATLCPTVSNPAQPCSVTLNNNSSTASAVLFVSSVAFTGADAGDFTESDTCQPQVSSGTSCTISVTFKPSVVGQRQASMIITDNAPGSPHTVNLTGTAVQVPTTVAWQSTTSAASPQLPLTFPVQAPNVASTPVMVTITNNSASETLLLGSIGANGNFSASPSGASPCTNTLAPLLACTFNVIFTPTGTGTSSGTLTINGNGSVNSHAMPYTINLTGSAGAIASLSTNPPSAALAPALVFPLTDTGLTSAVQTITLTNSSNFVVNLNATPFTLTGVGASEFLVNNTCGTIVPANGSCSMGVFFQPTATGLQTASLTVNSDAATPFLPVSLTGTGAQPLAQITSPVTGLFLNSLNLGNQLVGTSSGAQANSFVLTNGGTGPLNISGITITGLAASEFSATSTCGTQVNAGASCTVYVVFTPTAPYNQSATLNIADNAPGSPQTVALLGYGNQVAAPSIAPATLKFSAQALTTSTTQLVTITNNDPTYSLTLGTPALSGTNASDFTLGVTSCGSVVAAGAPNNTCTIPVTFTPVTNGVLTATLTVPSNGAGPAMTVAITGTGGGEGTISLSTTALNFGSVLTGQTLTTGQSGAPSPVTITNTNTTESLLVASIALSGSAEFSAPATVPAACASLAPGASCTFDVTFAPTATGPATASLQVTSSATNTASAISLTGTGSAGTDQFTVTIPPTSSTSELVTVGNPATYTLMVTPNQTNHSTATVSLTCDAELVINGALTLQSWSTAYPGSSCTISPSSFTQDGVNSKQVTVTITTNGSSAKLARPGAVERSVFLALLPFTAMGLLLVNRRRRMWVVLALLALCLLMGLASCGGGNSSKSNDLAQGNYTAVITAASNADSQIQQVALSLTVTGN